MVLPVSLHLGKVLVNVNNADVNILGIPKKFAAVLSLKSKHRTFLSEDVQGAIFRALSQFSDLPVNLAAWCP
jgi:hypothetical protein